MYLGYVKPPLAIPTGGQSVADGVHFSALCSAHGRRRDGVSVLIQLSQTDTSGLGGGEIYTQRVFIRHASIFLEEWRISALA